MPKQYLVDSFGLTLDRKRSRIQESTIGDRKIQWTVIPATLSVIDSVNGNKRRYRRSVWEKNLTEGSPLKEAMKRRSAFGLLEHPADGHVDLNSPIAVLTTDAKIVEGDGKILVEGEIMIIGTAEGLKLGALIEAGYDPTVSSRGFGSLVQAPDGIDEVQDDYVCEGWDVVFNPSFVEAATRPQRESAPAVVPPAPKLTENAPPAAVVPPVVPTPLPQERVPSAAPVKQPTIESTMDLKQIRESLATIRATDPSTLTPVAFAEGMARMHSLHNEVAAYVVENAKTAYEGQQLHEAIKGVEEAWASAITGPAKELQRLKESQKKLMEAFKQVTALAARYKKGLGESIKRIDRQAKVTEELARRARGWMAESKKKTAESASLDKRLDFVCESLEYMSGRYKADIAHLAKRNLTLEFKDLSDDEKKLVESAKGTKSVLAARKAIEEKRGIKPGKPPVNENKGAPAPAPAPAAAAPAPAAAPTPAPVPEGVTIVRKPNTVSFMESVALTKRLSASSAK